VKASVDTLLTLAVQFALMSLFAIGGANAALPEMHRLAVEVMGWMSDRQFNDMFALAQLTPGPNVIIVALIGYQAGGLAGGAVAMLSMCGPTCLLAYTLGRVWDRFKEARWRIAIQDGMVPVSLGLLAASAFVVAVIADTSAGTVAVTVITVVVAYATKLNPLWFFGIAAALGAAGWL
jgi:chromate transporter